MGKVDQQFSYLGFPLLFLQSRQGQIFAIIALFFLALLLYDSDLIRGGRKLQKGLLAPVIEENQHSSQVMTRALEELASAVAEYAQHLKSHTSAIISLSEASQELKKSAEEQNEVLSLSHPKVIRQSRTPVKVAQGRNLRTRASTITRYRSGSYKARTKR